MKKLLKFLSLALALSMISMFTFGCSLFSSISVEDAVANLEDNNYVVDVIDDSDELEEMSVDNAVACLEAINEDDEFDRLEAVLYKEKADAKKAEEDANESLEKMLEDAEESGDEELVEVYEELEVKRIGKWVVMGSKDAIDAFQGK